MNSPLLISVATASLILVLIWGIKRLLKRLDKNSLRDDIFTFFTEFYDFGKEVEKYQNHPDPVNGIVSFFRETSLWYDRLEVINGLIERCDELNSFPKTKEFLVSFRSIIVKTGRDRFGMNRTEYNQTVTDSDVYLGDVHGLFRKSVSDLKARKRKLQEEYHPDATIRGEPVTVWQVYEDQARSFMKYHTERFVSVLHAMKIVLSLETS